MRALTPDILQVPRHALAIPIFSLVGRRGVAPPPSDVATLPTGRPPPPYAPTMDAMTKTKASTRLTGSGRATITTRPSAPQR